MSENIVIQEGGIGKQLTADKLETNLVGGNTCLWVPEDETQLGTKHISENGTYKASDDGYYGYSEVTVSGIGQVSGKDPETGEDASIRNNAFSGCYGISEYHFTRTTPPTLSNTNAFTSIAADCIIYVPYSADHSILQAYKTATNWSTYASKMQEEAQD